jgi:hypothetical protein
MTIHSVKMPIGNGGGGIPTKGRPLETMAHLKTSNVKVKAEENCLAHVLIITIARLTNDPDYKAYGQERKILPVVDHLFAMTGIDLTNGGVVPELIRFQEHIKEYRIVVFGGLKCKDLV